MPLIDKIIKKKLRSNSDCNPGDMVFVDVDFVYLQDGNIPTVSKIFKEHNFESVFDSKKIACFIDHSVLSPTIEITNRLREAEDFITQFGFNFFRAGEGISHVIALENKIYTPHTIVVGADSHTCTGGVVQCLSLGLGATDIVYAMLTGTTWLKVPRTCWILTEGMPQTISSSKDVMLYALGKYKQEPFLYKSLEWCGEYINSLRLDSMATLSNMSVEQGAKCAFFPKPLNIDDDSLMPIEVSEDPDERFKLDISGLPPFISKPHSPFNSCPYHELGGTKINYVFVGSCANSRLDDLELVAKVFKDRKVKSSVNCVITPGSKKIFLEALDRGYISTFIEAGAIVTPPGCGSCVGTQGIIPADDDVVISTMNRNFLGRMGNAKSRNYLASPLIAAYAAILGNIPDRKDIES